MLVHAQTPRILCALLIALAGAPAAANEWVYDSGGYRQIAPGSYGDEQGYYDHTLDDQGPAADPFDPGPKNDALALRARPSIARRTVKWPGPEAAGTIVVSTADRRLRYVVGDGTAIEYAIGVGREGFAWTGSETITRKAEWPAWTPPAEMRARQPELPAHMDGGINNPLGARALYLGASLYRIHGTNEPRTIGRSVSSGCIRMVNRDVMDLFERAKVGATVIVK
jgi:lipoprotein-anchoring transpeptidase ErfK/SrfK